MRHKIAIVFVVLLACLFLSAPVGSEQNEGYGYHPYNSDYGIKWDGEDPELYVHPTYLDFGEMKIGETAWNSFYIENTGSGTLEWEADCDYWIEIYPSSYGVNLRLDFASFENQCSKTALLAPSDRSSISTNSWRRTALFLSERTNNFS